MRWNWQHTNWPDFEYNPQALRLLEDRFLLAGGVWQGSFQHLNDEEQELLRIEMLSTEALQTSRIEGEILDRESVQSSIRRLLGLQTDNRRVGPAEFGISEMMVDVYRTFNEPLTHTRLFSWHAMLTHVRRDLVDIGCYRTHTDPMQVVSGPIGQPRVHFEAPPSDRVPAEMDQFLDWFSRTHPHGPEPLSPLIRSGIAHLYFESIHPFEDGNGRIGRAISDKILAQGLGRPALLMLADTIDSKRNAYYQELEKASSSLEITDWLLWFADAVLEAQRQTQHHMAFVLAKARLFTRLAGQLNPRQENVLLRMFKEGPKGFAGGLSAKNYQTISGASAATATRDLQELVDMQVLRKEGVLKSTRYFLVNDVSA